MKNSEIVEGALEVIREKGWTKRSLRNNEGYCLIGAGLSAIGVIDRHLIEMQNGRQNGRYASLERRVVDAVGVCLPMTTSHPVYFNDTLSTTQQDVEEVLEQAAKYWRDRGE